MKKHMGKWIKQQYHWVLPVLILAITLAVTGSLAAYVNFNSVKRVVATGTPTRTYFSSNYLYLVNKGDEDYRLRVITPTSADDGNSYVFTIQVCNYLYGNEQQVNEKDISYKLKATLLAADGGTLPEGSGNVRIGGTSLNNSITFGNETTLEIVGTPFVGGVAAMHSYNFFVPKVISDSLRIQIIAEPSDEASDAAAGGKKLAAIMSMEELHGVNTWTGSFSDDKNIRPELYDGLNYEISGEGEGTVTIRWDASVLQISPWFLKDIPEGDIKSVRGNEASFAVGGTARPSAYQLQFYKTAKDSLSGKSWEELAAMVTVEFTSKQ